MSFAVCIDFSFLYMYMLFESGIDLNLEKRVVHLSTLQRCRSRVSFYKKLQNNTKESDKSQLDVCKRNIFRT